MLSALFAVRRTGYEEAVYWLELLIKYRNLDHLQINDNRLNTLQVRTFLPVWIQHCF